ncbi:flagellar export protein FliJ [Desulfurobacterium atlanticum]|uniref:Flagellar FliJ protein n=1 Tax=Desulfurobacterium atlanticum TaxID=240169 RepID=A0A238ZX48_9BACT|nr:flagellar export protein FliJ [Desulfurobacterium atlanticum]SNR87839.1 FliJ protein [Desulfurobacterium atlanticum]
MKALHLFLKHTEYQIKKEEFILKEFLSELDEVETKIESLRKEYSVKKQQLTRVKNGMEISLLLNYCNFILEEIEKKNVEKKQLLHKIQIQKQKLARLNGEKKAVEKFLEKKKRNELINQLVQEGRLADEVFSRVYADGDDSSWNA